MDSKTNWRYAYDRLIKSLTALGFPAELGDMIARHIGSPKGIERMTSYLNHVRPESMELIADEMIAIKSDIDRWRERKESLRANESYNNVLNNGLDDDE
ncbi:MAG: hypothetical protein K6F91_06065 [Ruminococcus sp.]|nr:hypothetical protein [Ruminococcus sp.]